MTRTADVVIVGGGCMGASLAWHLARLGVTDVVLVEREPQLGTQSTGRNAGGFRHQFSTDANIRLSLESIRAFEHFEDEPGASIDLHQDGYLFLLSSPTSVAAFQASVARQRALGVAVDWLDADDAARLAPGLTVVGVLGATFCARDGIADPNGVTQGYARAARQAGVEIRRDTEVLRVLTAGGRVAGVDTTHGTIASPIVVNAAGAWAGRVAATAGLSVPVEPLRRHIFLAQPPGASWDDPRHRQAVPQTRLMVIDFDTSFYFHREGGRMLFGMGDSSERAAFDTSVKWDFLPQVIEVALTRLPALADAEISHAWAGLYEMTPDATPIIGEVAACPGFYVLAGFSGHGFQHSPAAGRILADVIAGRDPGFDLAPFSPQRFLAGGVSREAHFV